MSARKTTPRVSNPRARHQLQRLSLLAGRFVDGLHHLAVAFDNICRAAGENPVTVLAAVAERTCRKCGCTDTHACEGGCFWVDSDLCSTCAPPQKPRARKAAKRKAKR